MSGLLNFSKTLVIDGQSKTFSVQAEDVKDSATSSVTGDAKKYWKHKTGQEILEDILKAVDKIRSTKVNGEPIFEPNTLIVPDVLYTRLIKPYNDI